MKKHIVDFEECKWFDGGVGIRFKAFKKHNHTIRLMELTDEYCDSDWCTHGHIAYILEGKFDVKFNDHVEQFQKRDTVFIPEGEENKHIASVPSGYKLIMISFEL